MTMPSLVGVIHLPPLPSAPRSQLPISELMERVVRDAEVLSRAGFDGIIVENFGDAPFEKDRTAPVTVATMTRLAAEVVRVAPELALGINVLRNDAEAALGIATAVAASFVRINVHVGARVTDQGVIEGRAAHTLRARRAMGAEHVRIWADVDVKHSAPLAPYPLDQEVEDVTKRGLAEAVLVTGSGTGQRTDLEKLARVCRVAGEIPVYVASGVDIAGLADIRAAGAYGVVVGSCLRADGKAGGPIDAERANDFVRAWRALTR